MKWPTIVTAREEQGAKGSDPLEALVTPPAKPSGSAEVLAEGEGTLGWREETMSRGCCLRTG